MSDEAGATANAVKRLTAIVDGARREANRLRELIHQNTEPNPHWLDEDDEDRVLLKPSDAIRVVILMERVAGYVENALRDMGHLKPQNERTNVYDDNIDWHSKARKPYQKRKGKT
jgi:hypothetical protein